jgi:hypothetical protein
MKYAQHIKEHQPPTNTAHKKEIISQNWEKSLTTVYKVEQFHQNNFNAPVDGRVGRNMLWKIG